MKPFDFPLLADENVHPEVIQALRGSGSDVRTVAEEGLTGAPDTLVLARARSQGRVVLTHDGDFGILTVRNEQSSIGIIYLRPGHMLPSFTLEAVAAIHSTVGDVAPPFVIVAERRGDDVRIRLRRGASLE